MHIHVIGICGSFMGGLALLAQQAGHRVTGCDANVYPPMSTQLQALGIELLEGFGAAQIALQPDLFVVGNVVTRGNPLMEAVLDRGLAFVSGPQWLAENILRNQWVLAVAGTHGKTTTSAMLAWILEFAGLGPGFLIGGVPQNFAVSARLSTAIGGGDKSPFFVIEADEYDTAFFDKRSKFLHYRARTTIFNNLEFDHADIFPDLAAIATQFHHFVRTLPQSGLLIAHGGDENLRHVLEQGCWTPVEHFASSGGWEASDGADRGAVFDVYFRGRRQSTIRWDLLGEHNRQNALAAIAAARHAGVPVSVASEALHQFRNVKRRMELRGVVNDISVYDDFAHHPTAIRATLAGLRAKVGASRILAVLEPRSNSMKLGVWAQQLAPSLSAADQVFCYSAQLGWDVTTALASLGDKLTTSDDLAGLIAMISAEARSGDHILIMSNGGFGGIHDKLLASLRAQYAPT